MFFVFLLLKRRRFDLKKKNWPGRPGDPVKNRRSGQNPKPGSGTGPTTGSGLKTMSQSNMSTEQARLSCSPLHIKSRIISNNILPRLNIWLKHHTPSDHPPLQFWANPSGQSHSVLNSSSGSDLTVSFSTSTYDSITNKSKPRVYAYISNLPIIDVGITTQIPVLYDIQQHWNKSTHRSSPHWHTTLLITISSPHEVYLPSMASSQATKLSLAPWHPVL